MQCFVLTVVKKLTINICISNHLNVYMELGNGDGKDNRENLLVSQCANN